MNQFPGAYTPAVDQGLSRRTRFPRYSSNWSDNFSHWAHLPDYVNPLVLDMTFPKNGQLEDSLVFGSSAAK